MRKFLAVAAVVASCSSAVAGITSGYVEEVKGDIVVIHGHEYNFKNAEHRRDHWDLHWEVEVIQKPEVGDRITIHYNGPKHDGVEVYAFRPHNHREVRAKGEHGKRMAFARYVAEKEAALAAGKLAAERSQQMWDAKMNILDGVSHGLKNGQTNNLNVGGLDISKMLGQ